MSVIWTVYRKPKRKGAGAQPQGKYRSEAAAKAAVAEGRKHQKEYSWSARKSYG